MRRLRLWIIAFVALAATCAPGQAETEKSPVRFIVGVPAGGSIDLLARPLAEKMKDILGEPVLVENRAGVNQRIALAEVRKSPPDARTLYIGTSGPFSAVLTSRARGARAVACCSSVPARDATSVVADEGSAPL